MLVLIDGENKNTALQREFGLKNIKSIPNFLSRKYAINKEENI